MVSPARELDRTIRISLLECMAIFMRLGMVEEAKAMGETSKKFAERMAIHNYDNEDLMYSSDRVYCK